MQPDSVRRGATAAVLPAMDMKAVQMLVTPGKQDLQDRMEVRQGGCAVHQHPTPDERADAAQDDPQLVDAAGIAAVACPERSDVIRATQGLPPDI